MSKKCYGIGVIGCGVIWNIGHWDGGLKHIPNYTKVLYVYDIKKELAIDAANKTGAKVVDQPDAIFEAPDVDIVTLATPPFARAEYVQKACEAGKHLTVEKPMARTIEDALSIFRAVRKSGVKCFVPFARAVSPVYRELVNIIQSGELGDPLDFIHTNLSGPYGWVPLDHWMHDIEKSGGPIFDYSIHFIELARACMDSEAKEVCYMGANTTGLVKSDDQATMLVQYESGGFGEFTKSWSFPTNVRLGHQTTHVVCRNAVVTLDPNVIIHTANGDREVTAKSEIPGRAEGYLNLISAIENGTPLFASELEGLRAIEILDTALKSRESGKKEQVQIHSD